jgi:hypothetical protein
VTALVALTVLADTDKGKGSTIGLFVVLALLVAVYFLYKSMTRHLRGLPESFDPPPAGPAAPPGGLPAEHRAVAPPDGAETDGSDDPT